MRRSTHRIEKLVRRIPRIGDLVAKLLIPIWIFMDGISVMATVAKSILIKRWSKQIYDNVRKHMGIGEHHCGHKNMAGLGGQGFSIKSITWNSLLDQSNDVELRRWVHRPNVVRETLFFEYFAPLEAWCDNNCHASYYLWSDDIRINIVLRDPMDELLWKMTWDDGRMPSLAEIKRICA